MSERPFPKHTIWRDVPLSHSFSASGLIYLWNLMWSESSLLTLESALLFSLGRHHEDRLLRGPFTTLSSAYTGVLYPRSTLTSWVNETRMNSEQHRFFFVWCEKHLEQLLALCLIPLRLSISWNLKLAFFFFPKRAYVQQAPPVSTSQS